MSLILYKNWRKKNQYKRRFLMHQFCYRNQTRKFGIPKSREINFLIRCFRIILSWYYVPCHTHWLLPSPVVNCKLHPQKWKIGVVTQTSESSFPASKHSLSFPMAISALERFSLKLDPGSHKQFQNTGKKQFEVSPFTRSPFWWDSKCEAAVYHSLISRAREKQTESF